MRNKPLLMPWSEASTTGETSRALQSGFSRRYGGLRYWLMVCQLCRMSLLPPHETTDCTDSSATASGGHIHVAYHPPSDQHPHDPRRAPRMRVHGESPTVCVMVQLELDWNLHLWKYHQGRSKREDFNWPPVDLNGLTICTLWARSVCEPNL